MDIYAHDGFSYFMCDGQLWAAPISPNGAPDFHAGRNADDMEPALPAMERAKIESALANMAALSAAEVLLPVPNQAAKGPRVSTLIRQEEEHETMVAFSSGMAAQFRRFA